MPLLFDPHAPQLDTRSELLKAQSKALNGRVNACPFDEDFDHLDENGYCRHLIGFSNDKKTFEPMVRDPQTGRRVVRCKSKPVEEITEYDDDGKPVQTTRSVPVLDKVQKGDRLIRITTSYRVYRDVNGVGKLPEHRFDAKEASPDDVTKAALAKFSDQASPIRSLQPVNAPNEDTVDIQAEPA